MKRLILLFLISFNVYGDSYFENMNGDKYYVYDETIKRKSNKVKYVVGVHIHGTQKIETHLMLGDCLSHESLFENLQSEYTAPGTVGRTHLDYACNYKY